MDFEDVKSFLWRSQTENNQLTTIGAMEITYPSPEKKTNDKQEAEKEIAIEQKKIEAATEDDLDESTQLTKNEVNIEKEKESNDLVEEETTDRNLPDEDESTKNKEKGGKRMAEEESVGCLPGCPDQVEGECEECEEVEFCCTLKIPAGFSISADDPEEYIEENFDVAAYFVDGCFDCETQECTIDTDDENIGLNCGPLTVTQAIIQGTIKVIGGFCVASDNALETGSQAPVCCETLVCVDTPTPVCIGCNNDDNVCENLRVIGADNVDAELLGISCEEFGGDGDAVWQISGELVFACGECPTDDNDDNDDNDDED